ncbi:hypothetical protein RJ641_026330 [Dillenia turbinata]|uniref:Uncharacterized protein n=1 Tax=Dillenia turbinata TaxID=194707 RepID=A0AAN8ZSG6_9MAGN
MENWRRQKARENRKPPCGSWQRTVPSWEKEFCFKVGSVPWRKLVETKKIMYLYENVVRWNDSAGEEAFNNAKIRFWADMNGLPCETSLPDPDIYIDKVDWDLEIDPQLILDLECPTDVPDEPTTDENCMFVGNPLVIKYDPLPSGWGDEEEDLKEPNNATSGRTFEVCDWNVDNNKNSWEYQYTDKEKVLRDNNWDNHPNYSSDWNNWNDNSVNYGNGNSGWRTRDELSRSGEDSGHYMSRYKTSRFHDKDHRSNRGWKTGKGGWNRSNFGSERQILDQRPNPRQGKVMNAY